MSTILVVSQVYVPDPASLGQHVADAAAEMARRGYRVVVLTSRRGYEDPRAVYPRRELLDGVEVRRLPLSSFGKGSLAARLLGATSFLVQVVVHSLVMRRPDGLLVSTSPPICSLAALVISLLRRVPILYWAMDLNPDQAVALGRVAAGSLGVRLFDALNRAILGRARAVVTLDRFMAQGLRAKRPLDDRLSVIPPWPLEDSIRPVPHDENPFRWQEGLEGKFVVMYSGNMSLAHPLDTLLEAALRLAHRPEVLFVFIGGGLGQRRVQEFLQRHRPGNVRLLAYQPLEWLRFSLSAGDLHAVSMGENMVGIVHPCKIYASMACARPVLLVGPRDSHAGELIERFGIGWRFDHGDVDGVVAAIEQILAGDGGELRAMGRRARRAIDTELGKAALCGRLCDCLEQILPPGSRLEACLPATAREVPEASRSL